MLHHLTTLPQVEQELRKKICVTCPARSEFIPGAGLRRTCEETCSLFLNLPTIKRRAELLEPIVGHHEEALTSWMTEMIEAETTQHPGPPGARAFSPLRHHQRRAAAILARFLNR